MGFIGDIFGKIGLKGGIAVASIIVPILLSMIKVDKSASAWEVLCERGSEWLSLLLRNKVGKTIENAVEWLLLKAISIYIIGGALSCFIGLRKNNVGKDNISRNEINQIKNKINSLFPKGAK